MRPVTIRDVCFGIGMPKIAVPLVGRDLAVLEEELKLLDERPFDLIEWRLDHFEGIESQEERRKALDVIRYYQPEAVLLATFRTIYEGGNKVTDQYENIYIDLIKTEQIDMIDVELFLGDELFKELLTFAHHHDVKVVASNHDFSKTPDKKEIMARFKKMSELKADFLKIALMPQTFDDVLTLLSATYKASQRFDQPIISMSMSKLGIISRVCGQVTGSCITFGSLKEASAPGQMNSAQLKEILFLLDRANQ